MRQEERVLSSAPGKAVMQVRPVVAGDQPLAKGESMNGPGGALGCDARTGIEHHANPETPLSVADALVEAKEIRVERRRREKVGFSRRKIKAEDPGAKCFARPTTERVAGSENQVRSLKFEPKGMFPTAQRWTRKAATGARSTAAAYCIATIPRAP